MSPYNSMLSTFKHANNHIISEFETKAPEPLHKLYTWFAFLCIIKLII